MKGKNVAAFRRRVELVRELRFDAGGFVGERQLFAPFRVNVEQTLAVLARLFLDAGQRVTFGLRLDGANGFAVDEEQIVHFIAAFQKRFADGDSARSRQVDRATVLNSPGALL